MVQLGTKNAFLVYFLLYGMCILVGIDDEDKDPLHQPPPAEDAHYWPTMQDLNTRLRRVITAYQRNYKKEELKQQQKQKVIFLMYL